MKEFIGKEFKESTEEPKKKERFPDWVVKR